LTRDVLFREVIGYEAEIVGDSGIGELDVGWLWWRWKWWWQREQYIGQYVNRGWRGIDVFRRFGRIDCWQTVVDAL
jgi:hypothetical protein